VAGVLTVVAAGHPDRSAPLDALVRAMPGLLVLDESELAFADGSPVRRLVLSHATPDRATTTELWLVGGAHPATLCATVHTGLYARLRPPLHRALRGFRG
jgi:hypothetical protein